MFSILSSEIIRNAVYLFHKIKNMNDFFSLPMSHVVMLKKLNFKEENCYECEWEKYSLKL
jgi:hypothetical protein